MSRIWHACNRCRFMRTKCSGGVRCTKCLKDDQSCVYGIGKREKMKRDLAEYSQKNESLKEEIATLLDALRGVCLSPPFRPGDHPDVIELLSKYSTNLPSGSQICSPRSYLGTHEQQQYVLDLGKGTETSMSIGKMSEIAWIQSAKEYLIRTPHCNDNAIGTLKIQYDQHTREASEMNYFLNDADLLAVGVDRVVARDIPPIETCSLLTEAYIHSVQGTFMFVHRERFIEALAQFPRQKPFLSSAEQGWLVLANLVFAVGAMWLQQTESENGHLARSHLEFYARARALGLENCITSEHPVLEKIQALGLLAFYLFLNGSISSSWTVLGHALRHAAALGLHLRIYDNTICHTDRVRRARTWYSLYCLEVLLSETTGRSKSIAVEDITVPIQILNAAPQFTAFSKDNDVSYGPEAQSGHLWQNFLQSHRKVTLGIVNQGSFVRRMPGQNHGVSPLHFEHRIYLCLISHRIGTVMYTAAEDKSRSDLQGRTVNLDNDLRAWREDLPPELSMDGIIGPDCDPRSRIELEMYYQSVRMILYRPFLCNINMDQKSGESKDFNFESARHCVEAALAMLGLMADKPVTHEAFQILPWWSLLHYVSQSAAVLFIELSLNSIHYPKEIDLLIKAVKKAMLYLYCMSDTNGSAYKAWKIFRALLADTMAVNVDVDIIDMLEDAHVSPT